MKYDYGFIGCGNMGSCLIAAVSKTVDASKVAVSDFDREKMDNMKKLYSVCTTDVQDIAKNSKYIVLGVKPQGMGDLLKSIANILSDRLSNNDDFILVTMAAGIAAEKICHLAGCECKVIRIMPNIPCSVGGGMVLCCTNGLVKAEDKEKFLTDMREAGLFDELEEAKIDMGSAISGCGPAFAYMFIEALADGGVKCGLTREKAMLYACKMLEGSAKMVMDTGIHPGKLKDNVCSPGGSTIEGVEVLEKNAFRSAVSEAVCAAFKRTQELGK